MAKRNNKHNSAGVIPPSASSESRPHLTRQLEIVHLSDIHFGKGHRFQPEEGPSSSGKNAGYPSLFQSLEQELETITHDTPTIVCFTGDFATTSSRDEFDEAAMFVESVIAAKVNGKKCNRSRVFVVPGNHDIEYKEDKTGHKWEQWRKFYNAINKARCSDDDPYEYVKVHDRIDDLGCVIACLNSTMYVEYGTVDAQQGAIDAQQLKLLKTQLEKIDEVKLESAIKICLIHHHPILIPFLAEPGRGYDAVQYGDQLVRILRHFRFNLLLHGHKHTPHVFTEDCRRAFVGPHYAGDHPMLVVAGGSVGSTSLESTPNATNTHNRITIKWHPAASAARIRIITRGLVRFDPKGDQLLPQDWSWKTLMVDDRVLRSHPSLTPMCHAKPLAESEVSVANAEDCRIKEYERLRGNMPVLEVRPSFEPGQAYEARFWLVEHLSPALRSKGQSRIVPKTVTWSAGTRFTAIRVARDDDPSFLGTFDFWDGMLVQGTLEFEDGVREHCYVYARVP